MTPPSGFAQVEAQFLMRGITSQETKFAYVVSSFQLELAQEVRDLRLIPPTETSYDTLKAELIRRALSEEKCLHRLLILKELGDRKPS